MLKEGKPNVDRDSRCEKGPNEPRKRRRTRQTTHSFRKEDAPGPPEEGDNGSLKKGFQAVDRSWPKWDTRRNNKSAKKGEGSSLSGTNQEQLNGKDKSVAGRVVRRLSSRKGNSAAVDLIWESYTGRESGNNRKGRNTRSVQPVRGRGGAAP